jgi:archaellum component FlaC
MIIEVKERLERIEKSIEMLTTLLETVIEAIKQQRTQSDKTIEVLDSAKIVTQEIGVTIKNEVHELEEKAK